MAAPNRVGCIKCRFRTWHVNPKTRQKESCPHCQPKRKGKAKPVVVKKETKETETGMGSTASSNLKDEAKDKKDKDEKEDIDKK